MEIKIELQTVIIKDQNTGEAYKVNTLRTAKEIAEFVEESEKEIIASRIEETLYKLHLRSKRQYQIDS